MGEAISTVYQTRRKSPMRSILLLPVAFMGLAGCAVQEPPQMTTTTYHPATTTTTTYASPAPGAPYTPIGSSTTYTAAAPGYQAPSYMAPSGTSTTYVTPGSGYMAPGSTTTVVRTP
jgi:hypothetical protein